MGRGKDNLTLQRIGAGMQVIMQLGWGQGRERDELQSNRYEMGMGLERSEDPPAYRAGSGHGPDDLGGGHGVGAGHP